MAFAAVADLPLIGAVVDFLFPRLCAGCAEVCEDPSGICDACRRRIEIFDFTLCAGCGAMLEDERPCPVCGPSFLPLLAYGNYRPPLREIIVQFKFKGIGAPARYIASQIPVRFKNQLSRFRAECIVPVPLHPHRQYRRGYNQARRFAVALSDSLGLPLDDGLVVRTGWRRPQSRLDTRRRERNVRNAFQATDTVEKGRRVILVDDVVTTGATVREAARVLEEAGCRVVLVIAMAHGL
jgi:ComF family protein